MTPEAQRIAIAEACGKVYHKPTEEEKKRGSYYQYEPDYLNDLNAMHEAEKVLVGDDEQREQYWIYLVRVCDPKDDCGANSRWTCAHATATQRAEAFLRTIGKWKE